ncbi:MAG: nuclear transport factor 2 family protein [Byssovorax sp.]
MRSALAPLSMVLATTLLGCAATSPEPLTPERRASATKAIGAVLDDFHDAAARADEARYFGHLTDDAVFLGTDAAERWDRAAFRAYAHPHFEKGKAWSFKATRRAITIDERGDLAWFDEDLDAPNLGPSRGSGVLARRGETWMIRQYNLAITVPNDRFDAVKTAIGGASKPLARAGCSTAPPP